ncbi:hypothetical protein EOE67_17410 [Rheinheimera riviphila]|uniref:Uncharacterized protein n=1 Tax=Rheinheimera riviphila TaxID=1834037 RepID=A0A437QFC0_9GAMM|nr:hypothetical protein [Rheinheimera riviphila]RVU33237.1 hypothetical protein EOE67_17410 [Rheinheimera riviphila]
MVSLYFRCTLCALYLVPQIAFAQVYPFPNTNTIPITTGGKAKLKGVMAIDAPAKTASVVIDARDKFGNNMRVFKTANFSPAKLKEYAKTCIKNPVACAASAILTAALIEYGYTITPDKMIVLPGQSTAYPNCVDKPTPQGEEGGVISAWGPIPCAKAYPNGSADIYTYQPMPQRPNDYVVRLNGMTFDNSSPYASRNLYYKNGYLASVGAIPNQPAVNSEITPEQAAEVALANAAAIQVAPGVYPDVFSPMPLPEVAKDTDIGTTPDPETDPETDPTENPEAEPMIDMSQVPTRVIDISPWFSFGSGWLPKSCPAAESVVILGRSFTMNNQLVCQVISGFIAPSVRILAIFMFLHIVIGAIRD